jgi:LacI family transcriptional regulator
MAIGALHAINAHPNLKHSVSVSGFDDMDIATYTSPSLTTVHSPITEMTALGIATLKHLLTNDELDDDIPFKKCFKMPIIYRESLRK